MGTCKSIAACVSSTNTVKTDCPFKLSITPINHKKLRDKWEWRVKVINLAHNHPPDHPIVMPIAQWTSVRDNLNHLYHLCDLGVAPHIILQDLDLHGCFIVAKDLDNIETCCNNTLIGNGTTTEAALHLLNESGNLFVP